MKPFVVRLAKSPVRLSITYSFFPTFYQQLDKRKLSNKFPSLRTRSVLYSITFAPFRSLLHLHLRATFRVWIHYAPRSWLQGDCMLAVTHVRGESEESSFRWSRERTKRVCRFHSLLGSPRERRTIHSYTRKRKQWKGWRRGNEHEWRSGKKTGNCVIYSAEQGARAAVVRRARVGESADVREGWRRRLYRGGNFCVFSTVASTAATKQRSRMPSFFAVSIVHRGTRDPFFKRAIQQSLDRFTSES